MSIKSTTIKTLAEYISFNAHSVAASGLYNGKAGCALSLFEAAAFLEDETMEDRALELIQEVLLSKSDDVSFDNGLAGIGYVLVYLIKNKFLDADFDEIFGDQYEKIIKDYENIEEAPHRLLDAMNIIYFLSIISKVKTQDTRINKIMTSVFEGVELYLSIHFSDLKNINYINNKTFVLKIYEIYLKLVVYSNYRHFSCFLLNEYAKLYRSGRIVSSLTIGYYINKITTQNNIKSYNDVINDNIANGIKNIYIDALSLNERIELLQLIDRIDEKMNLFLLPNINLPNKDITSEIMKMIRSNSFQSGYQFGLARYLIFCINKNSILV